MFVDKTKLKEKVAVVVTVGSEIKEENIGQHFDTTIPHADGCGGFMNIYYDINSCEVRTKCDKCGSAYTLARTEDGFFKRG